MEKTISEYAGLPLELSERTGELSFHDGLCCDGSSEKRLGQMTGLFRCPDGAEIGRAHV